MLFNEITKEKIVDFNFNGDILEIISIGIILIIIIFIYYFSTLIKDKKLLLIILVSINEFENSSNLLVIIPFDLI